jgi:hypothetical protein
MDTNLVQYTLNYRGNKRTADCRVPIHDVSKKPDLCEVVLF